jgi:hypothetical protein
MHLFYIAESFAYYHMQVRQWAGPHDRSSMLFIALILVY